MKELTLEQREKIRHKVELWVRLHPGEIDEIYRNNYASREKYTCATLQCKYLKECGNDSPHLGYDSWSETQIIPFCGEFLLPSIHSQICFGWLFPNPID